METNLDKPEEKEKSLFKRIFTFGHASFFLVLVMVAVTAYALFAPIVPAKYSKPIINEQNIVAGKTLNYSIHTCRYVGEAVVTTVTRKLVSTTDKQLTPIVLSTDTLTNERRCLDVTRTLIVPSDTPSGEYQLVVQGIYEVLPLRAPITVTATSDSFIVKPSNPNEPFVGNSSPVGGSSSSENPKTSSNSGSSSAQGQQNNTPVTNNTTTNNTTTNNTTSNNTGSSSEREPGLVQRLLNSLPFGL